MFVYSDIDKILAYLYKNRTRFGIISITTNGTVMPTKNVLDWIKKLNIEVTISDYECTDSKEFYNLCIQKGISCKKQ